MDLTTLLPTPDAIPAPWGWFQGLLLLCFLVHLLLMNAMFGSACIALLSHLLQRNAAAPCTASVSQALPSLIAFTVNFGVAPLLFVQVLYGHLIYTSSLLMAVYWLSVVGLLMAAYALAYLLKYQGQRLGWLRVPILLTIVSLFATIAFVFVNNIGLMQAPASWIRYFDAPRGLLLNLRDPMQLPRYLHFVLASVAVGGLSIAGFVHWQQQRGDWSGADWVRRGCRWFSFATMANILVGLWFLFSLPPGTVELSSAEGQWLAMLLAVGFLLSLPAIRAGLAGRVVGATLWTLATVAVMVGARELLRRALLAPWFSPAQLPVQPELAPMAIFLIIFVLGLGLIGWMVSFTRRNGNHGKGGRA